MPCVFCDLIRQGTAQWVVRESLACAFAPLDPMAPGHTLVVPTSHHEDIFDIPPELLAATMELVQRLARMIRTELGAGGVNILNASGPGSEQSVFHLHFHVVPRWADDGFSTWPDDRSKHRLSDATERLALAFSGQNDPG
ncbi:HIT family protein [Streptosporangium sp. NPDC000396]|uniref:HIT family protein n=1 Tax=Streptosporangium sp. NPDC000396 TaxID=3366185 RepID=UPI0036C5659C